MIAVLTQAGLSLASLIPKVLGARELGRVKPIPRSTKYAERKIDKAFDKHVDDIKPGAKVDFDIAYNTPDVATDLEGFNVARKSSQPYASSTLAGQKPGVSINPMADRAYYAHELGHLASQQTDVGYLVNQLRQNPKLAKAAGISLLGLPVVASALEAGDDDLDTSIALAALSSAPVLADEALATYHGQRIMDKAGLRTSLGQRGKLAGGLLSYMAVPVLAGVGGNMLGNVIDQDS